MSAEDDLFMETAAAHGSRAPSLGYPNSSAFARVRNSVEAACRSAVESKLKCCANLADLHCVEVLWCLDEYGEAIWLVRVEEASPDDCALQSFLRDKLTLAELGHPVTVETEW